MRLLVTGGAGFIGSNFVNYWNENYPEDIITIIDSFTYAASPKNLAFIKEDSNINVVTGDICDPVVVDKVMRDTDIVIHFAAHTHVDNSIKDSTPFIKSNVLGTHVLLEAAKTNKIKRFHHISTDEVFGSLELDDPRKFTETTPYDPRSPYSASKAASDHLVRAYYHTHGLPVTISNCSNNYGPRQHKEKLIPLAITNLLNNKAIPVYGNGSNVRDWLYVKDHCRAIDTILKHGTIGETYLVGGSCEMSNLEIVYKILDLLDFPHEFIEFVEDRKGHDKRYAIDWTKLSKLGWKPEIKFENGILQTAWWYKNEPVI